MPRELEPVVPAPLLELLDGEHLEAKEGHTLLLTTAAADEWPRLALLSVGEVYAPSDREIRLALWPKSRTTKNLGATGRGTLSATIQGSTWHMELEAHQEPDLRLTEGHFARFSAAVRSVRADEVGYAEITSGIRFRLRERDQVLARWRATIDALRR